MRQSDLCPTTDNTVEVTKFWAVKISKHLCQRHVEDEEVMLWYYVKYEDILRSRSQPRAKQHVEYFA